MRDNKSVCGSNNEELHKGCQIGCCQLTAERERAEKAERERDELRNELNLIPHYQQVIDSALA